MREKIRKATNRDMYTEIYKPITEKIESQKEQLSSQLKALPEIKQQLALLPKSFVDKIQEVEQQQKLTGIMEEPPPPELQQPLQPLQQPLQPLQPLQQKLDEKEVDKILEDYYNREKKIPEDHMGLDDEDDVFEESEEELGARPKEFTVNFNKNIDLDLLDEKQYYTPQEVFDFFHTESENPDKKND